MNLFIGKICKVSNIERPSNILLPISCFHFVLLTKKSSVKIFLQIPTKIYLLTHLLRGAESFLRS